MCSKHISFYEHTLNCLEGLLPLPEWGLDPEEFAENFQSRILRDPNYRIQMRMRKYERWILAENSILDDVGRLVIILADEEEPDFKAHIQLWPQGEFERSESYLIRNPELRSVCQDWDRPFPKNIFSLYQESKPLQRLSVSDGHQIALAAINALDRGYS